MAHVGPPFDPLSTLRTLVRRCQKGQDGVQRVPPVRRSPAANYLHTARKRGPGSDAPGRIRTCDTRFRKPVLYPLSYEGAHSG